MRIICSFHYFSNRVRYESTYNCLIVYNLCFNNELFWKHVDECKQLMMNRGYMFLEDLNAARGKIVKLASQFITDGSVSSFTNNILIK